MGFGTEILFMLMLGLVVLGPKRLHAMLAHVARAKAELENATRGMKSKLAAELNAAPGHSDTAVSVSDVDRREYLAEKTVLFGRGLRDDGDDAQGAKSV